MHANDQPGADPEPGVPPLLTELVVCPAGPHAAVGQLRAPDDQHLLRHRDADAVGHGAQPPVRMAEPAGKHFMFQYWLSTEMCC